MGLPLGAVAEAPSRISTVPTRSNVGGTAPSWRTSWSRVTPRGRRPARGAVARGRGVVCQESLARRRRVRRSTCRAPLVLTRCWPELRARGHPGGDGFRGKESSPAASLAVERRPARSRHATTARLSSWRQRLLLSPPTARGARSWPEPGLFCCRGDAEVNRNRAGPTHVTTSRRGARRGPSCEAAFAQD